MCLTLFLTVILSIVQIGAGDESVSNPPLVNTIVDDDNNIEFDELFDMKEDDEDSYTEASIDRVFLRQGRVKEDDEGSYTEASIDRVFLRQGRAATAAGSATTTVFRESQQNNKYINPNNIKDRPKEEIVRPQLDPEKFDNRFRQKFHPAWMDYCDPYHCKDYHKAACGLNRKHMKFQWFESGCHIAMNNFCSYYRGLLKFDTVHPKYCTMYVMYLRSGCQQECHDQSVTPLCALSNIDYHVVLFKNRCAFDTANCKSESLQEYIDVDMDVCKQVVSNN